MKSYSNDLCRRIIEATQEDGESQPETAARLQYHSRSSKNYGVAFGQPIVMQSYRAALFAGYESD